MDCFAALAMTLLYFGYDFAISRRECTRVVAFISRPIEGAGKAGCRLHPWVPCKKARGRTTGSTGITPAFPARWFYGLLRALPGDRAFLPPSSAEACFCELSASVGAPEPHDFAVRYQPRSSFAATRVHRISPHVRDDREPPLSSGETGRADSADLADGLSGIFFARGLDRFC